jgi:hypothetical protein
LDRAYVAIRTELAIGFLVTLLTAFLYIAAPGYMLPLGYEPTVVDKLVPAVPMVVSFVAWLWMLRLSRPNPEAGERSWRYRGVARLTVGPKPMPNVVGRVLLGLLPLWILLIRLIAFPGSMHPVRSNPPAVAGLPAGIVLVGIALAVMAIGVVALRRASSTRSALLAFLGLTVPAAAVVVVAPALILIVRNMTM